jgi:hypothetical protein
VGRPHRSRRVGAHRRRRPAARPAPDLVELARAFIELQEARHEADYDHTAQVDEADARAAIDTARDALARRPLLTGGWSYGNYLALLLGGPRVAGR